MRLAPSVLKYSLISHLVKSLRGNIAAHDTHGTSSHFPHTSVRCLSLVRLKDDTAWYTPHFVQQRLLHCSPLWTLCFDPLIVVPSRRHVWQRMFPALFRNLYTSTELYCVCLWLLPQAAHVIFKQVLHVLAPHRNWLVRLHSVQLVQYMVLLRSLDLIRFRNLDADALSMSAEASPGDRTQSNRISSRFRCGV